MKNLIAIVLLFFSPFLRGQDIPTISSDFPGGNIVVEKTEGDTIWLKPDLTETRGEWFYWYFKVSNISGKRVTFNFGQEDVCGMYGPAYSKNNNHTWKWYGEKRVEQNSFSYSFGKRDTVAFFCVAFPYVEKDFYGFLSHLPNRQMLKLDTLCFSSEGRMIEKVMIPSEKKTKYKAIITARHHACEMMASYELEGIIESILNDRNLAFLREKVEFMILPFMDKDGVENGEQGKNRLPRNHNADYAGVSIHHSTAALRETVPNWSEGKLKIALDLHCPWISGSQNEAIYTVGSHDSLMTKEQIRFSKLLEKKSWGEIKSYHKNFLAFGTSWNKYKPIPNPRSMSFRAWASTLEGLELATTIEFPYSNISGIPVTKDGARAYGKTIAFSIQEYLQSLE